MIDVVAARALEIVSDVLYVVAAIVALGVVVFVHELGHFIVGRRVGIKAEAFSIGFGPILWRKTVGETEYRISSILAGGYVKFAGMEGTEGKAPHEVERGFFAVSPGRRIAASFAGPFMNIVLAVVLFFVLWGTGRKVPQGRATTIVGGFAEDSPAEAAGIKPGDRIVSISGQPMHSFDDIAKAVAFGESTLDIEIERDGEIIHKSVESREDEQVGARLIGVAPMQEVSVYRVTGGSAAEKMGLRKGDRLLALDDEQVLDGNWPKRIAEHGGKQVAITVERDGKEVTLTGTVPEGTEKQPPQLGFIMAPKFVWINERPDEAMGGILSDVWRTLKALVTRRVKAKGLAGPVGIVSMFMYSLRVSFTSFLWLSGLISLNLAIINLLPIPVVDGGHIMFALIEKARRKPVRERTMAVLTNVFVVLIIMFFLYVTFYDVKRTGLFGHPKKDEAGKVTPGETAPQGNNGQAPGGETPGGETPGGETPQSGTPQPGDDGP